VDVGSSFLPSEIIAAFLWAQLEHLEQIQQRRLSIWQAYYNNLQDWATSHGIRLPFIPPYATNNAHMFYLLCESLEQRTALIEHLKRNGIVAVFHYQSLHKSPFYASRHDGRELPNSDYYSDCLVRLPMFYNLEVEKVIEAVRKF
ncbi:MAG: DegT/DnrJ/EryC1/StrS family aminotransferase, partial [Bacteroidia bacterium]|nr:DegT/DnrJ/EryC1/StrS family aminotransferase [Bacteroidia bacterium]